VARPTDLAHIARVAIPKDWPPSGYRFPGLSVPRQGFDMTARTDPFRIQQLQTYDPDLDVGHG